MIGYGQIALGILAGGRASRLNGADKARLAFHGETLLQRTLRAFPEPFAARLVSYNREPAKDWPENLRVVPDLRADFLGPLAALEALSAACDKPWLLTVPVDCRELPNAVAATLIAHAGTDGSVLRDGDGLQPLLALWRVDALRSALVAAFAANELAVHRLIQRLALSEADISPRRLGNLNTPTDFASP
jgi:molybdopterin-guanine dinucleotide biosynthesis protein A